MFLTEKNFKYYHTGGHFLESTEISASEDLNALEKAPAQFMALRISSRKGEVQIMPFQKLSGKCHFFLRFCTCNWSETYVFSVIEFRMSCLDRRIKTRESLYPLLYRSIYCEESRCYYNGPKPCIAWTNDDRFFQFIYCITFDTNVIDLTKWRFVQ